MPSPPETEQRVVLFIGTGNLEQAQFFFYTSPENPEYPELDRIRSLPETKIRPGESRDQALQRLLAETITDPNLAERIKKTLRYIGPKTGRSLRTPDRHSVHLFYTDVTYPECVDWSHQLTPPCQTLNGILCRDSLAYADTFVSDYAPGHYYLIWDALTHVPI